MDKSVKFSESYLSIIEECLGIEWVNDEPVFVPSSTNEFTIQRLNHQLTELFESELRCLDAITSVGAESKETITSVAFGIASDFDKLIKVGFLNSPRIVLWDILWSRGLLKEVATLQVRTTIGSLACEMLMLKDVILAGGITVLPPPVFWSDKARHELARLHNTPQFTVENMGLISALSICDELYLHPYTLFEGKGAERPTHPDGLANHEMFSRDHYIFHNAMQDLIGDKAFSFLENVRASSFYEIVANNSGFRDELNKEFSSIMNGKSRLEQEGISERARRNLLQQYETTNEKLNNYKVSVAGGALSSVAALGTFLTAGILSQGTTAASLAIGGLSGTLLSSLAGALQNTDRSVLVTTFVELAQAEKYSQS